MNKKNIIISISMLFTIIFLWRGLSSAQELNIPDDVFYYQPASTVFGSEAVWINPAALARYKISSYQFMFDYDKDNFAKSWGTVLNRDGMGFAYRKIENPTGDDIKEYIGGVAFPFGKTINFGLSYRSYSDGPDYIDGLKFWDIGFEGIINQNVKWGAVFSNVNREKINNQRSDMAMRYSLAYRPNKIKLVLAADLILDTKTKLGNGRYIYHAEFSPSKGLYFNGFYDSKKSFQIGFRTNLIQYFVGNKSNFVKNDGYTSSTFYIGATSKGQPSVIGSKKKD